MDPDTEKKIDEIILETNSKLEAIVEEMKMVKSSDIDSEPRQIWTLFEGTDPQPNSRYFIEGEHSNDTLKSGSNFDAELYQTWLSLHNIMGKYCRIGEKSQEDDHLPQSNP